MALLQTLLYVTGCRENQNDVETKRILYISWYICLISNVFENLHHSYRWAIHDWNRLGLVWNRVNGLNRSSSFHSVFNMLDERSQT